MTIRKITLLLLSPILLFIALVAIVIGFAYVGGSNPAASLSSSLNAESPEMQRLMALIVRCLLVPFQLIFIGLVMGAALALYRRRTRIAKRLVGPLAVTVPSVEDTARFDPLHDDWDQLIKIRPQRQLTLIQLSASLFAVVIIALAVVLIMGQFVSLTDLAIIVTALTSALTWGARLPVSDVLGGISNVIENNFNVGDRLSYRHFRLNVEGIVDGVNLRFTWLRALSGELITIPFGEIRTLRNFSRSTFAGVYVSFPVISAELSRVIHVLEALAPESPALIPDLLEPWRVVSQDGLLGSTVELSLYGRAKVGREEELQLALHSLVWERLEPYLGEANQEDSDP